MTAGPARDRDTVVVGLGEEPDMLVQDFSLRHASWAVLSTLMLKLFRYDDAWRAWPELAEELPTGRNGQLTRLPDGRREQRWRFRAGLRWHDGTPVGPGDAVFTYELLRATPPPYPHHLIIESIDEMLVDPGDDRTLIVRWRADLPFAHHEEWGTVLPRHLLAGTGLSEQRGEHRFARAPVFQGPYRFVEWVPGAHLVVERAGRHPLGEPAVRRIVFRFFPGPRQLRDAVIDGSVDVTDLTGFTADDVAAVAAAAPQIRAVHTPSLMWEHIAINLDDPVLADRRVRHALAHAVDTAAVTRALYGTAPEPARSWLPPRHPAHHAEVAAYPRHLGRARELLAAAGLRPGPDGRLRRPDGTPWELRLLTTRPAADTGRWTASSARPAAARLIAAQLAEVGIDLRIDLLPPDEAFPVIRRRKFPHLALFAWSMGLEMNGYLLWHSSKIPDDSEWYGINVGGWRDAVNDDLLDRIAAADEPAERYALMREQQAHWAAELPALPVAFPGTWTTAKPGLREIRPVGVFGSYVTWNAWQWHWAGEPS
ncbi:peptide ABC transporter substrate-binding protein [Jidongwangia harbinensis]|uniref:peptide ABC transporter substrate-binding protein n=1 Tax=Jidongwangia harbinensis TaxID=2878561 RepID=UPI001CDA0DBD|nr:peptide ABC transporter substrate-binding protein [Jidongwangia harbinensis]MCA2218277.1 peptide ABC transporter substrate-binding protein [Jidongwangia harbinensis]